MTERGFVTDNRVTESVSQKDSQTVSQTVSGSSSSTTQSVTELLTQSLTGARARACARAREDTYALLEAYDRHVGDPDRYVETMITDCLEQGMSRDVIMSAIKDTGKAHRPSKRYLESILKRYLAERILDFEGLLRDRDLHELRIQSALRRRYAKWYDDDSVLTTYDRACTDKYGYEDCNPDDHIPLRTSEYIKQRYDEILGPDGDFAR